MSRRVITIQPQSGVWTVRFRNGVGAPFRTRVAAENFARSTARLSSCDVEILNDDGTVENPGQGPDRNDVAEHLINERRMK